MLGVCRVCNLRVYRQEENLLDGCPIDNGADYTSKSGSLVSVLQYVLFSVQCCIYHSITVVKHWPAPQRSGGHTAAAQLSSGYF